MLENESCFGTYVPILYTTSLNQYKKLKNLRASRFTKIEFLGWDKHTPEGFEKCKNLIESANVYPLDEEVANKAIELKRQANIKLADAVIGATALVNDLKLATSNVDDFEMLGELDLVNPFD